LRAYGLHKRLFLLGSDDNCIDICDRILDAVPMININKPPAYILSQGAGEFLTLRRSAVADDERARPELAANLLASSSADAPGRADYENTSFVFHAGVAGHLSQLLVSVGIHNTRVANTTLAELNRVDRRSDILVPCERNDSFR
jgi:hypothetical protein